MVAILAMFCFTWMFHVFLFVDLVEQNGREGYHFVADMVMFLLHIDALGYSVFRFGLYLHVLVYGLHFGYFGCLDSRFGGVGGIGRLVGFCLDDAMPMVCFVYFKFISALMIFAMC